MNADGSVGKVTNHSGGVLGGISDGSDLVFRAAFKPTPSIAKEQETVSRSGENMELVISAQQIGIRESRRVMGEYVMTLDDFMKRATFDDEIGRYCYPVDIHAGKNTNAGYEKYKSEFTNLRYRGGESYGIPYRALVVKGIDNLLVAGRCISTDRYMQSSVRVMPGCYITGQAAGAAAAIASESDCAARDIDVARLQKQLKKMGAYLPNCKE